MKERRGLSTLAFSTAIVVNSYFFAFALLAFFEALFAAFLGPFFALEPLAFTGFAFLALGIVRGAHKCERLTATLPQFSQA
jgi:hypothetical protein